MTIKSSEPVDRFARRLRDRARRKFALMSERVRIGPVELDFTRVADPDAVLDVVIAEETRRQQNPHAIYREPLRMPYWAAVWESATAVGQHLAGRRELLVSPCLDLGCGMGLAGMAALALAPDLRVTLGDIDRDALLLARLNTLPWLDRTEVIRLDWSRDRLPTPFHLVIGSDVLYEREQWDNVEAFLRHHTESDGTVVLAEPGRPKADLFAEWIREHGWDVSISSQHVTGRDAPIRIFEIKTETGT